MIIMSDKMQTNTYLQDYVKSFVEDCENNDELMNQIIDSFQKIVVKRNEVLVTENNVCPFFCYV